VSDPRPDDAKLTINVDGREVKAKPGEMVISAAERGGVYIPRFCWHPRLKPVGMCRMCLVEIKGPRGFALMPACYVPVADGQEIVTDSPKVKKAQDGVLEFLLINHPLDCPVCDRGGECPLQDQTFVFGPGESRFVEEKRHWEKPIAINPLVALDRERCIQCARCTRFADEVAGDPMIDFVGRSDQTEVNTFPGQLFESNFSANIVQICPVGALTAIPYRFRARPWDLEVVESTCTFCSVGCRIAVQSSSNRVIRHLGVDSDPVNHGWLCDKGRFGYEAAANEESRLLNPLVRKGEELVEVSWAEALRVAAEGIRRVSEVPGPHAVAILGGSRLADEDAFAWSKLARSVIGTDNLDCQMADGLPAEVILGLPRATIDDACGSTRQTRGNGAAEDDGGRPPTVILLAPDLKEELPVLYLRLRAAALDGAVNLVEFSPQATGLAPYAKASMLYRPGEAAVVARALAEPLERKGELRANGAGGVPGPEIAKVAELLAEGDVVVVVGRPSVAEPASAVVDAAGILAAALPRARFLPAVRRGNVLGALDMGLAPGVLPGRVSLDDGRTWFANAWGEMPRQSGLDAQGILEAAADSRVQALVLLGADPISDFPDRQLATKALSGVGFTVAVDLFATDAARYADVILPAAAFGERAGTTTNLEGRVTRLGQKVTPPGTCRPDWMIAADLARLLGADLGYTCLDDIAEEIERLAPSRAGLTPGELAGSSHRDGLVVPLELDPTRPPLLTFTAPAVTRPSTPVDAYSLRLVSGRRLYDDGALVQYSPSLAALVGSDRLRANPYDLDRLGVTTGDRVRVASARGSLVAEAVADAQVPRGSAVLPFNLQVEGAAGSAADLIDVSLPVTDIRIETIGSGAARPAPRARH